MSRAGGGWRNGRAPLPPLQVSRECVLGVSSYGACPGCRIQHNRVWRPPPVQISHSDPSLHSHSLEYLAH